MNRCCLILAALCWSLPTTAAPLNVVFIIADDLGARDITPFNPDCFYDTPHLQRLADSGMRFTQAFVACSTSSATTQPPSCPPITPVQKNRSTPGNRPAVTPA